MATKEPPYFMYFPGNYRWSAEFINMMGTAVFGGSDIGELHKIGTLVKGVGPEDDDAWFNACAKVADGVRALAEKYESTGHRVSAAGAYLRACNYYQMAERFRTPKDAKALAAFKTGVDCFHKHAKLTDIKIEIVEVPMGKESLPGYFVPAPSAKGKRAPCVVFFDGLDVTKEIQFMRGVPDLIKRGISCLIMDGPGTGEAIRFRGNVLRHDYEVAGSACMDWLEKRDDVDAKKVGVVAISLGGYYAPRAAAFEQRFAACIAWGAQWDYWEIWRSRFEKLDSGKLPSLSVAWQHLLWIFNVQTRDEAMKKLEGFRLDGVVQKITCPFLMVHGEGDEQIPLPVAQKCFDAVGSKNKTFKLFTREEGGYHHCQIDNASIGVAAMWDWLESVFFAGR